jgi:hypothetical protein
VQRDLYPSLSTGRRAQQHQWRRLERGGKCHQLLNGHVPPSASLLVAPAALDVGDDRRRQVRRSPLCTLFGQAVPAGRARPLAGGAGARGRRPCQEPAPETRTGDPVPIVEVEDTLRQACRRFRVRTLAADPYRWARSLQILADEGLPVEAIPRFLPG